MEGLGKSLSDFFARQSRLSGTVYSPSTNLFSDTICAFIGFGIFILGSNFKSFSDLYLWKCCVLVISSNLFPRRSKNSIFKGLEIKEWGPTSKNISPQFWYSFWHVFFEIWCGNDEKINFKWIPRLEGEAGHS